MKNYRKFLLLMVVAVSAVLSISSCMKVATTYTIINRASFDMELFIYEYNEQGKVIVSRGADFEEGATLQYEADPTSTDVKIYIKSLDRWVAVVYPLNIGANKEIYIEDETLVQPDEPMN